MSAWKWAAIWLRRDGGPFFLAGGGLLAQSGTVLNFFEKNGNL